MDDPILFNPDNRQLGSATGDFGMYGGQSDPAFSIHHARDDAPVLQSDQPAPFAGAPGSDVADTAPSQAIAGTSAASQVGAGEGFAPQNFLITAPVADFHPIQPTGPSEAVAPVQSDWNPIAPGAGAPTPALDAQQAGLADGVVAGTAAGLLDDLAAGHADVLGEGGLLAPAGTLLSSLDGVVSPITGAAGDTLTTTLGTIDDTLDGLAGSDPLGGVVTLVNLISVSDMFDLNAVDMPVSDAAGDNGLGIVDVLAGEELLPDALLGGSHHDGGLLGNDHSDHPLGL